MPNIREQALTAKAWPFEEARKLLARLESRPPDKGYALFETGYGPSGLPHIGTFGEVARTAMVRHAFAQISDVPTRLFAFSDDMDGFRKVPENLPEQEMLSQHLGKPMTAVPDPFGTHDSLGAHNNARLHAFLDDFGFEYEFKSSTECYASGAFDDVLLHVLERYDQVIDVILPTLGEERRATYSPFLPLCPDTGQVLQVPVIERNLDKGTIVYDNNGAKAEVPVTGGHCKLQWKADWAMRWVAFDVDYEMSGKDLIDSVRLSSRIAKILGGEPPASLTYELFLDDQGAKISKSKGNGLSIEEWLTYATPESLSLYMYHSPKKAKRLYFDVIPRHVDDYVALCTKYAEQDEEARLGNPVWHIHGGAPPPEDVPLSFSLLLNLVSASGAEQEDVLWGFIENYEPGSNPDNHPLLARLVGYAIRYYHDFVKPNKVYRAPTDTERAAMEDLLALLGDLDDSADGEAIQSVIYEVGKRHDFENLRDWFKALYEVLFGQSQGPRMGTFVAIYGRQASMDMIAKALARDGG